MTDEQSSRREVLKKAAYVAPAILTLTAVPSFASNGSGLAEREGEKFKTKGNNGVGNGLDPQPPGNPPVNDGPGTGPGNPGNNSKTKTRLGSNPHDFALVGPHLWDSAVILTRLT